jgi:transposase
MMGRVEASQERLFYHFRLEDQVPATHLLRKLDALLDLDLVRKQLEPFYSEIGRPSVDPELMIRMLLIGYCYSIRSERRLCDEVRFNLAYRWFCGLGLEAAVPHHSTFSVNRHGRFRESAAFRLVFESVVARCMKVGLVGGEGFAVDASVVEADASRYQRVEGSDVDWSDEQKAQRPVREYLAALESENSPVNPRQAPKAMSPSDPAAAWTTRGRHKVQFAYSVNHLVDLLDGVIVDVAATPTRISMEVDVVETMLDRVAARFDLKPERITADVAYGTGDLLGELVARNIAPHIPVWDKGKRDNGTLSREDFRFEPDRDLYLCPRGNVLKTTGKVHDGRTLLYRASKHDCDPCPLKLRCCPKEPARKIPRDVNEAARDLARGLMQTEGYRVSARQRKMIETGFADMKRNLGLTRLRLRGLAGANDEFLLAATVQNLRRLAKAIWPSPAPTTSPTPA